MMKRTWVIGAAISMVSAGALAEPSGDRPESVITVFGEASASRPADYATINGQVRGEGHDQLGALKALAARLDDIEDRLTRLAGATAVAFETSEIKFSPVLPEACQKDNGYTDNVQMSSGPCAPMGVIASLEVSAKVHPATEIGGAAALAVESGLNSVSLGDSGLDNPASLEQDALRAAIDKAQSEAETIAVAAHSRLGKIVRISRGGGNEGQFAPHEALRSEVVVTANRRRDPLTPTTALKLTVPKVTTSTNVVAVYNWEP